MTATATMSIDYAALDDAPRLLMEAKLKPLQGHRFQPTGFPDLGPARYTLPNGTEMLLVESVQSVANRMELTCWDEADDNLIPGLQGLPYIRIDCGELGNTNTLKEFHRLNSPYIWEGNETEKSKRFREAFMKDLGLKPTQKRKRKGEGESEEEEAEVPGILDLRKLYRAAFKWDTNSVLHGLFLEKVAGRLRMARALSGFIEATHVCPAENGGTKIDHILPSPKALGLEAKTGYGNVPFPRTEFTGEIKAYFNLDLALLRGYGLGDDATRLLIALSLFKIRRFLSTGLRLRSACDLELDGDLTITRPLALSSAKPDFVVLTEDELLKECARLIDECTKASLFASPPVTKVEWRQKERPVKVELPQGVAEPPIPDNLKDEIEWKKGSAKKPAALKFKRALTGEIAEKAKALFPGNKDVANAIDEALNKQQSSDNDGGDSESDGKGEVEP